MSQRHTSRPTFLSTLKDTLTGKKDPVFPDYEPPPLELFPEKGPEYLYGIGLSFPKNHKQSFESLEQLLTMLTHQAGIVSFDIIAEHTRIVIQLVCDSDTDLYVRGQLKAYLNLCILTDIIETSNNTRRVA